jgi:TetR/AcrR family transcriptional regulator, transcriptional repressor for nem operon
MIALLEATVRRGQQNGEIAASIDPCTVAIYLYSFGQGLRVMGRVMTMLELAPTIDLALRGIVTADHLVD